MTANAQQALAPGALIDTFEIVRVLGTGGFGITYKAWDHRLQCEVAVKEYLPSDLAARAANGLAVEPSRERPQDAATFHDGLQRFLDEARILARFRDPYVVGVKQFITANGTAYLVMDYERGRNLSEQMAAMPAPMPAPQLRHLLDCLLSGLATLHGHGVLHRDIKPANVYLRNNGDAVLIDFGSARQTVRERDAQDLTSVVTHGYAPHEQYHRRGRQGPWTDLYALGATLYHCLTGHKPAGGMDRLLAIQDGWPDPQLPAAEAAPAGYPGELVEIIDWLMRVRVEQRPPSAQAVRDTLAGRSPVPAPPAPVEIADSPAALRDDGSTLLLEDDTAAAEPPTRTMRAARVLSVVAAAAVVAAIASVPLFVQRAINDALPLRIAAAGEQAFGLPTEVRAARAAPYSRRITIEGLSVANPAGFRSAHALRIDTITAMAASRWWWLQSAPRLTQVELSGVTVFYEAGGSPNRSNLEQVTSRRGVSSAATPIEVEAISVIDGRVSAASYARGDEAIVKPIAGFTLEVPSGPSPLGLSDALRMITERLSRDAVRVARESAPMRELTERPRTAVLPAKRPPDPVTPETFPPLHRNARSLPQRVADWLEQAGEALTHDGE
jgi:serine/threonine protein kinase